MVTYESVAKAVEELERDRLKPTVSNVRNRLNGGSNTKILAVLQEYFKNTRPELPPVSDDVIKQLRQVVEAASAERSTKAVTEYKEQIEILEANQKDLANNLIKQEEENAKLMEGIKELQNENASLHAKVDVLNSSLNSMKSEVDKANKRTQEARDELTELKLRKDDWEEAKRELTKALAEATDAKAELTDAKVETARLKGILEGREQVQIKVASETPEPEPTVPTPVKGKPGRPPRK
jgi:chromosome segregation ATPase